MPFKELCQLSVRFELHTVCSNSLISHHQSVCSLKLVFHTFCFPVFARLSTLASLHVAPFHITGLLDPQTSDSSAAAALWLWYSAWSGDMRGLAADWRPFGKWDKILEKICLECSGEKKKTGHTFITEPKGWLKVTVILMLFRTPEPSR